VHEDDGEDGRRQEEEERAFYTLHGFRVFVVLGGGSVAEADPLRSTRWV
jgi:hypothetical protein